MNTKVIVSHLFGLAEAEQLRKSAQTINQVIKPLDPKALISLKPRTEFAGAKLDIISKS